MGGVFSKKNTRNLDEAQRCALLPHFETPTASPRFDVDDDAAMDYLHTYGYVVIAAALDVNEISTAKSYFWDFLELSSGGNIQRSVVETWGRHDWGGSSQNGLFETDGVGQSTFLWYIRSRPKVLRAFQHAWSLPDPLDLLMSFDGCCAFRPTNINASWRTMGGWYHVDQNGRTTGCEATCVQGFVSLSDQDATTGGLAVLPGSHQRFRELFDGWSNNKMQRDFCILPRDDPMLTGQNAIKPRLVHVKAGDLVLWDSRCVHCNVPAWHPFDEQLLDDALTAGGLENVDSWLQPRSTVADAVWAWHNQFVKDKDVMEKSLAEFYQKLANKMKADLEKPTSSSSSEEPQLLRLIAYVCALPRNHASPQVLRERRRAVLHGATATHWPNRAEFKSYATHNSALMNVETLPSEALYLIGCEGPDIESMRAQMQLEVIDPDFNR